LDGSIAASIITTLVALMLKVISPAARVRLTFGSSVAESSPCPYTRTHTYMYIGKLFKTVK